MADSTKRFRVDRSSHSYKLARDLIRADRELRQRLIQKRLDRGMSQAQLAEKMGVSQPTVAAFEAYDNDPKMSTVRRYAQALEVSISHIVDGEQVGAPQDQVPADIAGEAKAMQAFPMDLLAGHMFSRGRRLSIYEPKVHFVYGTAPEDDDSAEVMISLRSESFRR